MKKLAKSATLAVALVSCATIALPVLSQASVFADTQVAIASITSVDKYLKVPNFVSTGNVKAEYTLAKPVISTIGVVSVTDYYTTVEVYSPFGGDAVKTVNSTTATDDDYKFTPSMSGTYKVVYTLFDDSDKVVSTSEFDLNIAGVSTEYTISAPVNSENIVPETVATKDSDGNATVVTLPDVTEIMVTDSNGDILTSGQLSDLELRVVLATPTADNGVTPTWDSETRKLTVDKTKNVNVTYTAVYSLVNKDDVKLANLKMSFVAKADYTAPAYTYSYDGTKPSTAEIGVETTLPSVSATSENGKEDVAVYYTIKITHTNSVTKETETYTPNMPGNKVLTEDNGQFTFIPNDTGSYVVEYTIKDFNGNAPTTSTTKFSIDNVSQTTAPTPKMTLPYTNEGEGVDAIEGFNEVQDSKNIMILPIDADDNANGYVTDNLTLYRQIWDSSKSGDSALVYDESTITSEDRTPTKALIFNQDDQSLTTKTVYINGVANQVKTTDMVEATDKDGNAVTLSEGSYIVKYYAKNKLSGKDEVLLSVPLKIVTGFDTDKEDATFKSKAIPTVTFDTTTTLPSSANLGDKITFKVPTATQKTVDDYSHTNLSTYIKYELYKGTTGQGVVRYDAQDSWITLNEDKTEYTLNIDEDATDVTSIKIFACSTNDLGNEATVEQVISIVGTGDTQQTAISAVDVARDEDGVALNAMQGEKVYLPSVTYSDDLPEFLNVKIVIDGDEEVYNGVYENLSSTSVVYKSAYFTPEEARTYTISYISTDAGRNQTILSFTMTINPNPDTYSAVFDGLKSEINGGEAELGERISIPSVTVNLSDEENLEADKWYVEIQGPANVETDNKTYVKFNKVGEYTIQYFCNVHDKLNPHVYTELIESAKYTIKVTDTQGPKLLNKVAIEDSFNDITKNGALTKSQYTIKFVQEIPDVKAENTVYALLPQASDVVYEKSTLSIVASGLTLKTINLDDSTALTTGLSLTRDDVYQFTYTLKDTNGNSTTTDTYTVDVGDVIAPEVTVKDGAVASNYTVGNTVKVDFSKITAQDTIDGALTDVIKYSVTEGKYSLTTGYNMTITAVGTNDSKSLTINASSSTTDRNNLEAFFQFTDLTADEYTFKVAVTDPSSKVGTNTDLTFKVAAETTPSISGEDVLGIVLIVVAVVALGGVVTYFVVTRKKYKNKF